MANPIKRLLDRRRRRGHRFDYSVMDEAHTLSEWEWIRLELVHDRVRHMRSWRRGLKWGAVWAAFMVAVNLAMPLLVGFGWLSLLNFGAAGFVIMSQVHTVKMFAKSRAGLLEDLAEDPVADVSWYDEWEPVK